MTHKQTIVKRRTLRREPRIGRWLDVVITLNFIAFGISTILTDVNQLTMIPAFVSITTIGALLRFNDQHQKGT